MAVSSFLRGVLKRKHQQTEYEKLEAAASDQSVEVTEPNNFGINKSKSYYYKYLFEGSDTGNITVPQKLVVQMVTDSLRKKEQRANAIPRLPMIIPKLLRSLRDPNSSAKDYVDIVNKDPVMSAAVLKLANSVYFTPTGSRIGEIERAVVKLGIDGLRSVLSAAVMQPIIQRESPYFSQTGQRLWQHSLACAVACEVIGKHRCMDRFKVYLMGLVHDVGKITLFSELCKQFKLNGSDSLPGYHAFAPTMQKYSANLSYLIAKDWELPEDICEGIKEQAGITAGKRVSANGLLLCQANLACEIYAITPVEQRDKVNFIFKDMQLPPGLFEVLDNVNTDV